MSLATGGKNAAVAGVAGVALYLSIHSADPGGTGASELTGGSPAYARKSASWGSPSGGAVAASSVTFDIPAGSTAAYFGMWSAVTAGTFEGGGALSASEVYGAQGTYVLSSTTLTAT